MLSVPGTHRGRAGFPLIRLTDARLDNREDPAPGKSRVFGSFPGFLISEIMNAREKIVAMGQLKTGPLVILPLMILLISISGCERTIEEGVIQPIESMVEQKGIASMEVSVSNVRTVRAALMRYPANSPDNLYPSDMEVFDYESLREALMDENLPPGMGELMWDPVSGIVYISDGFTFTFEVRSIEGDRIITATPSGVTIDP